ncbi:MAG: Gfo/Idh/MocA family oxidoreductase [Phycisphaerales bacterium]
MQVTRRNFVGSGAAAVAAAALATAPRAFALPRRRQEVLKVGVIGCGGRGTGAAINALEAGPDVRVTALADAFPDRLAQSRAQLEKHGEGRATVPDEACFTGLDAFQRLLATDCQVVILATPPGFRPIHFAAAVDAGKNVFMEKPVAVCPAGVRQVIDAGRRAAEKKLSVVAGTQRRHEACYEAAMAKIRDGLIGRPIAARCFWNMGGLWVVPPEGSRSDLENQMRNWLYHTWLSGDHIVEQHVHNIDVVNWAFGAMPIRACAVGGRQARTQPQFGHIYDHFAVDFEYPDGRFALSMARQQDGTSGRVEELIHGTDGVMKLSSGMAAATGLRPWTFAGPNPNPYVVEHQVLQEAIRSGQPVNEASRIAESTLCAIMGRMAAYSGQDITWEDAMKSPLDLRPGSDLAFGPRPQAPVAVPGKAVNA